MEGLAAAATIIQVAGAGLALAQTLYNFCDEVSTSNEQLKDLAFYVRSTSFVLEEIGKVFQNESNTSKPVASQNAIDTANEIAQRCARIFKTLQDIITGAQGNRLRLLNILVKSSRIRVRQAALAEMRMNLQCMMQVITYARLKAESRYATLFSI